MKFKLISGQVMVELLLALAVSALALVAMTQVATKSLSNSGYSRNRSDANKYAVEAIEWIRAQRSTHTWPVFSGLSGLKCLNQEPLTTDIVSQPAGNCAAATISSTIFTRYVNFSNGQADVTVSWNEKGRTVSSVQSIIFKQY